MSALSRWTSSGSARVTSAPSTSSADRALLDRVLAERREHVGDVVHEHGVRPDDEHAGELTPVGVEEERRAVQPDGGLAGARATLDHERRGRLAGDQPVLVGLNRGDDVAHAGVAAALELLEQQVVDRAEGVVDGAVERLVADVQQLAAARAEAAPERDPVRLRRRGRVERPRRRRLPVDDEDGAAVVVHPAPADVQRVRRALDVEAPEAEPALRVLERAEAPRGPCVDRVRSELGGGRVERAPEALAHAVEALVRVVDVGLLGWEIRMRHGRPH